MLSKRNRLRLFTIKFKLFTYTISLLGQGIYKLSMLLDTIFIGYNQGVMACQDQLKEELEKI